MSPTGRPEGELLPPGGKARSAKGAPMSPTGRPEGELLPPGGKARSAKGAPMSPKGRPEPRIPPATIRSAPTSHSAPVLC